MARDGPVVSLTNASQYAPRCCTFYTALGWSDSRFARNFKENDLTPCIHGNTRKVPHSALSLSSTRFFYFVFNYAKQHALLLSGRVPRYSCSGLHLLPSSVSKRAIWRVYHIATATEANGSIHSVAHTTFYILWRKLTPSVIVEAKIQPLLAMPTKQHSYCMYSKPSRGQQVSCIH